MADNIRLQHGAPPWVGSSLATEHVETYHLYDIPLIGLINQDGVTYLFQCVAGQIESLNFWAYTIIEPDEIKRLEAADADEFDEILIDLSYRPGVAAVAIDGSIIASCEVEDWRQPGTYVPTLFDAVDEFGRRLLAEAEAQRDRLVAAG